MFFFFETLYRADPRGKSFDINDPASLASTEYYQPHMELEYRDGKPVFLVSEKHGFFDDKEKRLANQGTTLEPIDGFDTEAEAWERYQQQLRYRASQGFVHALSVRIPEGGINHRVLDFNASSLRPPWG